MLFFRDKHALWIVSNKQPHNRPFDNSRSQLIIGAIVPVRKRAEFLELGKQRPVFPRSPLHEIMQNARDRQKPQQQCDDHADAKKLTGDACGQNDCLSPVGAPTSGGACAGSRCVGCAAGSPTTLAKDAWQARPTFLFGPLCPRGSKSIAQLLLGGL